MGLALDLEDYHPSVLLHCWLDNLTCKIVSEMTYEVSSGTLNPTIPYLKQFQRCFSVSCFLFRFRVSHVRVAEMKRKQTCFVSVSVSSFVSVVKAPIYWPIEMRRAKASGARIGRQHHDVPVQDPGCGGGGGEKVMYR